MIVSETASRVTSRWLQASALLCAAVVLPVGTAYAQDYNAIGTRLRAAVQAGELTGEQARAMLGALRETAEHEGDRNARVEDERVAKYRGIADRIKAAVEAGKLSEEDAEKKLIAIRMAMWPPEKDGGANSDDVEDWIKSIGDRLKRAVEAGKLSEEEAWAIWREIEKAETAARLKTAVEKGKLTEEEARAKWAEINEENDDGGDDDGDEDEGDDDEGEGIQPVPAEAAHAIGKALLEAAPMDFAGDPSQAVGVFAENEEDDEEEGLGMILVPAEPASTDCRAAPDT